MTQMMNWWINIKWQRLHSDTQIQRVTDDSRNTLLWISSRDDGRNKGRLLTDKRYEQFKMNQQNTYFEQLESSGKHKSNSGIIPVGKSEKSFEVEIDEKQVMQTLSRIRWECARECKAVDRSLLDVDNILVDIDINPCTWWTTHIALGHLCMLRWPTSIGFAFLFGIFYILAFHSRCAGLAGIR